MMTWRIPASAISERICAIRFGRESLGSELQSLASLKPGRATAAVVFYAARILEMASRHVVLRIDPTLRGGVTFEHIDYLRFVGVLDDHLACVFHALRRLGNHARHFARHLEPGDEQVAVALLRCVVDWAGKVSRSNAAEEALPVGEPWAPAAEELLEHLRFSSDAAAQRDRLPGIVRSQALLSDPTLCCMAAERLIELGLLSSAEGFLRAARDRHRRENRLLQLEALRLSRDGRPDEAIAALEPLVRSHELPMPDIPLSDGDPAVLLLRLLRSMAPGGRPDVEVAGILAGAKKRLWLRNPEQRRQLEDAHRLYLVAWRGSPLSFYAGGNAAATALWLGKRPLAQWIASLMSKNMSVIEDRLNAAGIPQARPDHYRLATLAEMQLIEGRIEAARQTYQAACDVAALQGGPWRVTTDQLDAHLRLFMPGVGSKEFLDQERSHGAIDRLPKHGSTVRLG